MRAGSCSRAIFIAPRGRAEVFDRSPDLDRITVDGVVDVARRASPDLRFRWTEDHFELVDFHATSSPTFGAIAAQLALLVMQRDGLPRRCLLCAERVDKRLGSKYCSRHTKQQADNDKAVRWKERQKTG
jgi:hypothetical protein